MTMQPALYLGQFSGLGFRRFQMTVDTTAAIVGTYKIEQIGCLHKHPGKVQTLCMMFEFISYRHRHIERKTTYENNS